MWDRGGTGCLLYPVDTWGGWIAWVSTHGFLLEFWYGEQWLAGFSTLFAIVIVLC